MTNFVISGEAGQGIESVAEILAYTLHYKHFHVYTNLEYMSRVRGGCNSTLIKVTNKSAPYYSKKIDALFILNEKAYEHLKDRCDENTYYIDASKINTYAIGYITSLLKIEYWEIIELLKKKYWKIFSRDINLDAFNLGYEDAKESKLKIELEHDTALLNKKLFSGNMSQSLGAIAGGANFIAFYPMSPSTNFSIILTQFGDEFKIISEQAEDEICAINMALGASYTGARACVSTSGGGFALMCEGVSLSGMIETPVVIHLGQRPGPATGLPTRTAQEDLNLALYSGHGEFERVILSPSNIYDSFEIAQRAFNQAQKYQIPVFILSEQCLLEATYAIEKLEPKENEDYIIPSWPDYKRYDTGSGPVSQLCVPGCGEGFVCVDSDEHDELGWITEDMNVRIRMVHKRLRKLDLLREDLLEPYFIVQEEYSKLIVSWGSTYEVLKEAIKERSDFALLHYRQLYPLGSEVEAYSKDKKLILIEHNATGQLGKLIMREFGLKADYALLKYDGMPLSIEEIERFLDGIQ